MSFFFPPPSFKYSSIVQRSRQGAARRKHGKRLRLGCQGSSRGTAAGAQSWTPGSGTPQRSTGQWDREVSPRVGQEHGLSSLHSGMGAGGCVRDGEVGERLQAETLFSGASSSKISSSQSNPSSSARCKQGDTRQQALWGLGLALRNSGSLYRGLTRPCLLILG